MAHDEAQVEKMIQDAGKTAPRLTPDYIDSMIVSEHSFRGSDAAKGTPGAERLACLTICVLTLKNGFMLVGESACASPENYNAEIGHKIARDNARNKIWALEGYVLRNKIAGL